MTTPTVPSSTPLTDAIERRMRENPKSYNDDEIAAFFAGLVTGCYLAVLQSEWANNLLFEWKESLWDPAFLQFAEELITIDE